MRILIKKQCYIHAIGKLALLSTLFFLSTTTQATIRGRITDVNTGLAIEDALVSIQASDAIAATDTTDSAGNFILANSGRSNVIIVAAKKGYYNNAITTTDNQSGLGISLEPVPQANTESHWTNYTFTTPTAGDLASGNTCARCHPDEYADWFGSPMSNAGVNTWVHDIYDGSGTAGGTSGFVYLTDSVHRTENPNSECAACHQPESWINEPFSAMKAIGEGSASISHGVSCEVCHKIADIDASQPNYPGIHPDTVTMNLPTQDSFGDPAHDIQYGALGDTSVYLEFEMRPSLQPQLSAEICGACHQDKNDHDNDGDFEDEGGVISEPTFVEWLESDYGDPNSSSYQSCVDCHMTSVDASAACNIEEFQDLNRPLGDIRSHDIRGTTPEFLDNAVTLTLDAEYTDGEVIVDVNILNDQTGHHVPTGVTIRNMILLVEATDENGNPLTHAGEEVIHDLGGIGDPSEGYYAGLPGKLYAKINQDATGASPTFFTDATSIQFDNRIAANASDSTQYTFTTDQTGEIQINAKLIYRRSWRFLVDAKQWTLDGHGQPLEDVMAPHYGHLMEASDTVVTIPGNSGGGAFGFRFLLFFTIAIFFKCLANRKKTSNKHQTTY